MEHSGVLVEVGQTVRVDLVVQPGEQTQTVTVTGEVPAIDTTDATLGGTVSNQSINALPLNGRNFERLLQLRPGTVTRGRSRHRHHAAPTAGAYDKDMLRVEGIAEINACQGSSLLNHVTAGEIRAPSCPSMPSRSSAPSRIPRRNMASGTARS